MIDDNYSQKKARLNLAKESSGRKADQFHVNEFQVHQAVNIDVNVAVYQRR